MSTSDTSVFFTESLTANITSWWLGLKSWFMGSLWVSTETNSTPGEKLIESFRGNHLRTARDRRRGSEIEECCCEDNSVWLNTNKSHTHTHTRVMKSLTPSPRLIYNISTLLSCHTTRLQRITTYLTSGPRNSGEKKQTPLKNDLSSFAKSPPISHRSCETFAADWSSGD